MSSTRSRDDDAAIWMGARFESALLKLVIVNLWRLLKSCSEPIGRLIAFLLWTGRSTYWMVRETVRFLRQLVKWMMSSVDMSWAGNWCPLDLRRWHAALGAFIVVGIVGAIVQKVQERFDEFLRRKRDVLDKMAASKSYAEWSLHSLELRNLRNVKKTNKMKPSREMRLFDENLFVRKLNHLKQVFEGGDINDIVMALRTDLVRKLGNMTDSHIYQYPEALAPIREYIAEVKRLLEYVTENNFPDFSLSEKLSFLQETRHTFGRTALLLSGGGALGAFHFGVVKALLDCGLLPRIVGGSSAGSIASAVVGTHNDAELRDMFEHLEDLEIEFFSNSTLRQFLAHLLVKGHLHDESHLQNKLKKLIGNHTFLEAYEKTGRVVNVVVCAADANEPPRVLNYLTSPHVIIWSAVAASSAFPGLFPAQGILSRNSRGEEVSFSMQDAFGTGRLWRDGSLEEDLPIGALREMFNVNYFMVSQTNPHIVPILNFKNQFNRKIANAIEIEWKHRCQQLQNLLPDGVPSKWLTLFSQTWEGDVTMVLPTGSYWTMGKAVVNPTKKEVLEATHTGELATWEQLSAIQCNCTVEKVLDSCLSEVTAQMKRQHVFNPIKCRIPSWLHMPVLGMPNVESLESLLSIEEGAAPVTPQREFDFRTGKPDCCDESGITVGRMKLFDSEGYSSCGLDVIAP